MEPKNFILNHDLINNQSIASIEKETDEQVQKEDVCENEEVEKTKQVAEPIVNPSSSGTVKKESPNSLKRVKVKTIIPVIKKTPTLSETIAKIGKVALPIVGILILSAIAYTHSLPAVVPKPVPTPMPVPTPPPSQKSKGSTHDTNSPIRPAVSFPLRDNRFFLSTEEGSNRTVLPWYVENNFTQPPKIKAMASISKSNQNSRILNSNNSPSTPLSEVKLKDFDQSTTYNSNQFATSSVKVQWKSPSEIPDHEPVLLGTDSPSEKMVSPEVKSKISLSDQSTVVGVTILVASAILGLIRLAKREGLSDVVFKSPSISQSELESASFQKFLVDYKIAATLSKAKPLEKLSLKEMCAEYDAYKILQAVTKEMPPSMLRSTTVIPFYKAATTSSDSSVVRREKERIEQKKSSDQNLLESAQLDQEANEPEKTLSDTQQEKNEKLEKEDEFNSKQIQPSIDQNPSGYPAELTNATSDVLALQQAYGEIDEKIEPLNAGPLITQPKRRLELPPSRGTPEGRNNVAQFAAYRQKNREENKAIIDAFNKKQ